MHRHRPLTLPGDDSVLVARAVGAGAAALALGVSLAGSAIRLPGLPDLVSVVPTVADHIPMVRHQLVRRLGNSGTDLLFSLTNSLAAALTVSPTSAAARRWPAACSPSRPGTRGWPGPGRHEVLAQNPPEGGDPALGTAIFAAGPGEEFANRFGWIGLSAAAVIGALSRNPSITGAAALATAPKPTRATREAFGCAMTRGLTSRHDVLVVRPRVLRALDRVDVIVIDPRALYTDELTITRVRGVSNSHRTKAWQAAQFALDDGRLGPGWHKLSTIRGAAGPARRW